MTEKEARKKIVKVANGFIGAKQGSAKHKELVDVFNKVKPDGWAMTYSAFWCACSTSAWAIIAFGIKVAKKYFPLSANCGTIIKKAKNMGIWKESDAYKPELGDWMLYDWQDSGRGDNVGDPDHVGLVEDVDGKEIIVIEGNKSKAVGKRKMTVNGRLIRGYVTPDYAKIAKALGGSKEKTEPKKKESKAKGYYIVKKGDTLSGIAEKFNTTWKKLQELNKLKNPDLIRPGQKIRIK